MRGSNVFIRLNHFISTIFIVSILFVLLGNILFTSAKAETVSNNLPTKESIQNQLNLLNKRSDLSAEDKLTIGDLEQALLLLDNIQQLEKKADDYNKTVEQLPEKLRSIQNLFRFRSFMAIRKIPRSG